MEKVTNVDLVDAARKTGYTLAMLDAIRTVRNELGPTDVTLRICEELQRLTEARK